MNPVLNGEKIILRKLKKSDASSIYKNTRDKDVAKHLANKYLTSKTFRNEIPKTQKRMRAKTAYAFGIEYKESGKIIGVMAIAQIDYKNKNAELGWWIGKKYWGKGIATEAIQLILNFAFKELKLRRVFAHVYSSNKSSAKLCERNGFKLEGTARKQTLLDRKWNDEYLFGLLKEECH